jgi:glycosyltransferase involved in cell wall biosynthesis
MRLSVIIPVFNRADLLVATLESIVSQTRPADEIIVVDDGSTDDVTAAVSHFGKSVTMIRQQNAGPAAARNHGFRLATGDMIQFFDSDDLMSRNKLEVQLSAILTSAADIAYCPWAQAELIGPDARLKGPVLQQGPLPSTRPALDWYLRGWVTVFQTLIFPRKFLEAAGPFDERLMPTEDSELLFRMLSLQPKLIHTPDALVLYRVHPATQISSGSSSSSLQRARDWLLYKQTVLRQLEARNNFGKSVIAKWTRETKEAALDFEAIEAGRKRFKRFDSITTARLSQRILRKLNGIIFDPAYQEGAITSKQVDQLRELGYEPTRDPAFTR